MLHIFNNKNMRYKNKIQNARKKIQKRKKKKLIIESINITKRIVLYLE